MAVTREDMIRKRALELMAILPEDQAVKVAEIEHDQGMLKHEEHPEKRADSGTGFAKEGRNFRRG